MRGLTVPFPGMTPQEQEAAEKLSMPDLLQVMMTIRTSLMCQNTDELNQSVRDFSQFIEFEYVICGHKTSSYDKSANIDFSNLSVPQAWITEYHQNKLINHDPIRFDLENRLARRDSCGIIVWDQHDHELTQEQHEVIRRRKAHGLHYGFSAFCNLERQSSWFLVSFASGQTVPNPRATIMARMLIPHLTRTHKRISLQLRLASLTKQEQIVADWMAEGKTNWEIAQIMEVSERTVKFHIANILKKVGAPNRQYAIAILIAERFMT